MTSLEEQLGALDRDLDLKELGAKRGAFNVFRVLGFVHGEVRHSRVLAWLLTPDESHGLGEQFLRRWLSRVLLDGGESYGLSPARVAGAQLRSVQVLREWARIDLLVRVKLDGGEEWVIAIENKIRARQGYKQLERYKARLAASFPHAIRVHVFLTRGDESPDDDAWIEATHGQIAEELQSCLGDSSSNAASGAHVLIQNYLTVLKEMIMPDEALTELARKIYLRHRKAIDFIVEQQQDNVRLLSDGVRQRMEAAAKGLDIVPMHCSKGYVRFLPRAWDTPANRAGRAWGSEGSAYILCEIVLRDEQPLLKIVEGSSPATWRKELYELAGREKRTLFQRKKMPAQWMSVYRFTPARLRDDEDIDAQAEAVWLACENHVRRDARFNAAVSLITAHLERLPTPG